MRTKPHMQPSKPSPARLAMTLASLLMLALTACDSGHPAAVAGADYVSRISRVLEVNAPPTLAQNLDFPRPRDLQTSTRPDAAADLNINLLELLALNDCALSVLVAEHNNSLGKLAGASQGLLYELQFLQLAPDCIAILAERENVELAARLQEAISAKQAQLPEFIWRAILGAAEYRSFWNSGALDARYPEATNSEMVTTLERLRELARSWLAGDVDSGHTELEPLLATLRLGDGGQLWDALALQNSILTPANHALKQRLNRADLCYQQRLNPEATTLFRVTRRFWIDELQAWSARVSQRSFDLLLAAQKLEQQLEAGEPKPFKRWRELRDKQMQAMIALPEQHVELIQSLLQQCGTDSTYLARL